MTGEARIRALVVDDEPLARDGVVMLLAEHPDVEVVGECRNGRDAVAAIERLRPDLVFLDVQMPGMTGFDVLAALDPARLPVVVFVTAYDRYALRAFEVHALDYLLKPFDDARFHAAVARAKEQLRLSRVSALSERLVALLSSQPGAAQASGQGAAPADRADGLDPAAAPAGGRERPARVAVKSAGRVVFLDIAEIDWIEAADYYVQLHVKGRSYLHRQSMASLEQELDPGTFVRIHRSAIVNRHRIREIRHSRGGRRELVVVLDGDVELKVARSHRDKLRNLA